jgi:hypothetical protein
MHKYLLSYLFSMYNYYVITILLSWIIHIHKQCENLWKLIFQFPSQVYFIKLSIFTTSCLHQMNVFSKVPNTYLYTKQKEIKEKNS